MTTINERETRNLFQYFPPRVQYIFAVYRKDNSFLAKVVHFTAVLWIKKRKLDFLNKKERIVRKNA